MQMPFYKNPLYITLFTVFVDLLGFGILIPILPELLTGKHASDFITVTPESGNIAYIYYGLLLGVFPLAQFFATPIFGQLSDKFGRKNILAFALAASTFCYLLFAVGIMIKSLPLLFLSRFLGGITGGNIAVAQSVISDISHPNDKSRNFGYIGAAFGLGFIIGPFLGAILAGDATLSISVPFWFTTGICLLNTILVWKFLPETQFPTDKEEGIKIDWMQSITELRHATSLKNLKLILFTSFLFQAGFTFLTTFINPYLSERFGWHIMETGYFFGCIVI